MKIINATINDAELIIHYIKELVKAEKLPYKVSVTKKDVEQNIFGKHSNVKSLIFYHEQKPCGFAVYYFTFSTATGKKGLHLDDLYIDPSCQGKGFGTKALIYLAKIADENDCARFEWWALKTNTSAINFYEKIGSQKLDELHLFRLDHHQIKLMAKSG